MTNFNAKDLLDSIYTFSLLKVCEPREFTNSKTGGTFKKQSLFVKYIDENNEAKTAFINLPAFQIGKVNGHYGDIVKAETRMNSFGEYAVITFEKQAEI